MQLNVVQQMYGDLRIEQPFARPSTPEDNPYIVALFSTTKRSPTYPGPGWLTADDTTVVQGYRDISYTIFFWDNKEHYHSGIGYVTPEQQHTGRAYMILKQRKKQLPASHRNRIGYWRSQPITDDSL